MSTSFPVLLILFSLSFLLGTQADLSAHNNYDLDAITMASSEVLRAMEWARSFNNELHNKPSHGSSSASAVGDCVKLYEDAEERLSRLADGKYYDRDDAVTWLSAAMASHRTCLDGLEQKGLMISVPQSSRNLTLSLKQALARYAGGKRNNKKISTEAAATGNYSGGESESGLLERWSSASSKADVVVAQDGSGNYMTIKEAVEAVSRKGAAEERVVVYVKAGIYKERIEIQRGVKNVMLVGDGMDKTIITGDGNIQDGATTIGSATFRVLGDGFWARDVTFENTAGPHKHQAVALAVASDRALFYKCSMKGYQDTLMVHSLRQFYRDCHIYGTIDFIFGDASAVLQNCDIFVKRPLEHQINIITAQGRVDPNENTGISILNSRVIPTSELTEVKGRVKSYLGRPWRKYSRTVFIKTELDGLVEPKGWIEWAGNFALSTLYYGEFMNTGPGASTEKRVNWAGFHVLKGADEASPFCVKNFIQGNSWIPESGVPFGSDI